jgi:competence protein ComGC
MALAGHCAACGENVWLTPAGTCPRGHGADRISNVYETAAAPAAPPVPTPAQQQPAGVLPPAPQPIPGQPERPRKSRTVVWVVVAVVLAGLLGCCLVGSILAAVAIPAFTAQQSKAEEKACFSNERNVAGAAQTFAADNNGEMAGSLQALVDGRYLKALPECPADGTYTFDPYGGTISCSVHGHY